MAEGAFYCVWSSKECRGKLLQQSERLHCLGEGREEAEEEEEAER